MTAAGTVRDPTWAGFIFWMLVGAGGLLGLLTVFTIGILVLPVIGVLAAVIAARRRSAPEVFGLLGGVALPQFWVAWLNRDGPGTVCTHDAASTACTDELNPWPWVVAGVLFVLAGVCFFKACLQRSRVRGRQVVHSGPRHAC